MGRPKGEVNALVRAHLRPGMTAVDVGAHTGDVTQTMAECVGPTGRVFAFEPDPAMFVGSGTTLSTRVEAFPWVQTAQIAIADLNELDRPFYPQGSQGSLWAVNAPQHVPVQRVQVRRLDDVVDGPVDLVKLDAQGAEVAILAGAPRLLRECPTWIVECWPCGLAVAGTNGRELYDALVEAGLSVAWADGEPVTVGHLEMWLTTQQVFVNWLCRRS